MLLSVGSAICENGNWVFKSVKYSLCSESVLNNFRMFWQDGALCDVDLVSGDTVVKAHRVILAAACVYFETMLKPGFEECDKKVISLICISPDVLPLIVEFIYTGQTVICGSTVQHLVDAADLLRLEELSAGCIEYLRKHLQPSNVLGVIRLAETHNLQELAEEGLSYARKHWKEIAMEEELLEVPLALLIKLLTSNNLMIDDEVQVLCAALRWLDHDPASRKQHCIEVLQQMRLRNVSPQVLEATRTSVRDPAIAELVNWFIVALSAVKLEPRVDTPTCLYLVGGNGVKSTGVLCTAVMFDGKVWNQIASMSVPRREVGVAALGELIYAVGGRNDGGRLASGEVYDPSTNRWTPIASMQKARYDFGLAGVNNKLYAFGGAGVPLESSIEVYDPEMDQWAVVGEMLEPRGYLSAITYRGAIYIVGGRTPSDRHSNDVLRYDPHRAEWRRMKPLLPWCDSRLNRGASVAVHGPNLYVVGGLSESYNPITTIRCYNLETEESYLAGQMLSCRSYCVAGVVNDKLVVAGGHTSDSDAFTDSVEIYDITKGVRSTGPSLPEARLFAGAAVL